MAQSWLRETLMPHMTPEVAKFLQPLNTRDQAAVMAAARPWKANAEEVIYNVGDHVPGIWMLDAGLVRYEFVAHDGRQVLPGFSSAGACFGELEILEGRLSTVRTVTSMACEGWVMSAGSMLDAIEAVPAFGKLMLLKLARNVRIFQMLYQAALVLGQHERLALALLNLAQQVPGDMGRVIMVVPVTQEKLCQVTGSSRQLVSKYLQQWTKLGWIAPRYGSLEIIDPEGLKSIFPASVDLELFLLLARTTQSRTAIGDDKWRRALRPDAVNQAHWQVLANWS